MTSRNRQREMRDSPWSGETSRHRAMQVLSKHPASQSFRLESSVSILLKGRKQQYSKWRIALGKKMHGVCREEHNDRHRYEGEHQYHEGQNDQTDSNNEGNS